MAQMLAQLTAQQEQMQIQSRQQQELIQTLLETVRSSSGVNSVVPGSAPQPDSINTNALQAPSPSTSSQRRVAVTSSVATIQAVKLIAMQLPEFDDSDSSDVELWLSRVEKLASMHSASPEITFLSA